MPNWLKYGLIIFVTFVITGMIFVSGDSDTPEATPTATVAPTEAPTVVPTTAKIEEENDKWTTFRSTYVNECVANGGSEEYCVCSIDHMENEHGREEVENIALQYVRSGEIPDELYDAVNACVELF